MDLYFVLSCLPLLASVLLLSDLMDLCPVLLLSDLMDLRPVLLLLASVPFPWVS